VSRNGAGARLNALLLKAGLEPLEGTTLEQFEAYLSLILRWNAGLNLTSVRTEDAIISIHLAESIACARALSAGVATLLDFGSGAGLPGIPIALCRPEIAVTLAESQGKKAAFLHEAIRVLQIPARVYGDRAETIGEVFDCVVLRAVDRMPKAVAMAAPLVAHQRWLALMTTDAELSRLQAAAGAQFSWAGPIRVAGSTARLLALGRRIKPGA
jgi:16S rRNA (guanine527-N7)-methyltransferase